VQDLWAYFLDEGNTIHCNPLWSS